MWILCMNLLVDRGGHKCIPRSLFYDAWYTTFILSFIWYYCWGLLLQYYSFNFKFCRWSHRSQSFNTALLSVHENGEDLVTATETHLRQNCLDLFPVTGSSNGLKILTNGIFQFIIYFISQFLTLRLNILLNEKENPSITKHV